MPNYDFRSLSPIDFEILVRDLLQKELSIRFETFKSGADTGIDLRHCTNSDKSIVVQCKHYIETPYRKLIRQLKKQEAIKVKKLQPTRYIFATSIGLTPPQKKEIKGIFTPFIRNLGDVYGRDDLNNLLSNFPEVEKCTFKLWLFSTSILEDVLHKKLKNVSKDAIEKIREHAKFYVQNESFGEALQILEKNNFCIIAGAPGIGKTTLAEMLCMHHLEFDYEIIKISGDISEASVIDYHDQKRIFYYDDFLGQTSFAEKLNKNEDQKLLDFIHAISRSKVSRLILTTREYILNQARRSYEKLARQDFYPEMCIIDLSKYTRLNRAKILFNHIYFSDLPVEYKTSLLKNRFYLKIIDHRNYIPRIIDLMTKMVSLKRINAKEYPNYFISRLDNPIDIWRHAFEEQLSNEARHLLIVMTTFPGEAAHDDLKAAFNDFHYQEASRYKFTTSPHDFDHALKEVGSTFITTEKSKDVFLIRFQNPSVKDFMRGHLTSNEEEIVRLIQCAYFYDQLIVLWGLTNDKPQIHDLFVRNSDEYANAAKRVLNRPSCGLINVREFDGNIVKERRDISLEYRIYQLADIFSQVGSADGVNLIQQQLQNIEHRIVDAKTDRETLVPLLFILKKKKLVPKNRLEILMRKARSYLSKNLFFVQDYEYFIDFIDLFPDALTKIEKDNFMGKLKQETFSCYTEDPDVLRDDAYRLQRLTKKIGVDLTNRISELESRADELEEIAELKKHDSMLSDHSEIDKSECDDEEIESIFNALNETETKSKESQDQT